MVQCDDNADNVAANVKTCGCAQNQAVELTTAIAKTEVDVLKTKGSDKIFVAAGTAKKWDAAGRARPRCRLNGLHCNVLRVSDADILPELHKASKRTTTS